MSRGHEVDIMGSGLLKSQHHGGQLGYFNLSPVEEMTDGVILAEYTSEITSREENGPGSTRARYGRLFTVVEVIRRDNWVESHATNAHFAFQAIDTTFPGAHVAGSEEAIGLF